MSHLITNIAWKKKSFTLRCTRFYCRMENLNDLVKEHLVVVKRIQVLLSPILINWSITTFNAGYRKSIPSAKYFNRVNFDWLLTNSDTGLRKSLQISGWTRVQPLELPILILVPVAEKLINNIILRNKLCVFRWKNVSSIYFLGLIVRKKRALWI